MDLIFRAMQNRSIVANVCIHRKKTGDQETEREMPGVNYLGNFITSMSHIRSQCC